MKRYILLAGVALFFAGCADKEPVATSVTQLAGNIEVAGWADYNKSNNECKPKVIVKEVVKYKLPPDSDGDGVPDIKDKCPNTPSDLLVNHEGCPIITTLRFIFDFNSYKVKKIYYPEIEKVAKILNANPNLKIEISGHTDNSGSPKYNLWLSQKRAEAVKNILVNKYNVKSSRLIAKGYGDKYPLVPNTTETNRALNRRVEIVDITNRVKEVNGSKKIDPVRYLKKD